ncbi:MAG: hypothetical protein HZA91_13225 [Verrucomicrobia bacterium]|nr:hypothetical protein [Verrucomicrobiota bacterium]
MKTFRITCWLLLAAALAADATAQTPSAATALPYKSFHAKILVSAAGMSGIPSEIWFRAPDRFRMVNIVMGRPMTSIMVGQDVFTFQQGVPIGMKLNRASMPGGEQSADQMLRKAVEWKQRGRKVGSEAVHGRPCDIYEFSETVMGRAASGKVWLWTANGFPLRSVTSGAEMTVTEIQLDVPLADALFAPPSNIQFQDVGGIMRNLDLDQLRQQLGGGRQ